MSQNNEHVTDSRETTQTNTNSANEPSDVPDTSMYPRLSPAEAFDGIIANLQLTREQFAKPTNNIASKLQKFIKNFRAFINDGYRTLEALENEAGRGERKSVAVMREEQYVNAQLVEARLSTDLAIHQMGIAHVAFKKAVVEETALLEKSARLKK